MSPMKPAALLLAALLLSGCGIQHTTAADRSYQTAAQQASSCVKVARPVDRQLTALASRMSVGMMFDDYNRAVGSARVAYDRMLRASKAAGGMSRTCVKSVGEPLRGSLNAYIRALNVWNRCNYPCSISKGPAAAKARKAWRQGARLANKADAALRWLQP